MCVGRRGVGHGKDREGRGLESVFKFVLAGSSALVCCWEVLKLGILLCLWAEAGWGWEECGRSCLEMQ